MTPELLSQCWFLAGPTASGKSAAGLVLAQRLQAEIVSLDSMAIYRGMDIGTAKPTPAERSSVPHHLIDIADPHEDFSVADFVRLAADAAGAIVTRGRVPLFIGGTGLYLRSILRGISAGPAADWGLRRQLQQEAAEHGPGWLHDQLTREDPKAAERISVADTRRIIRALEVCRLTGRTLSESQTHGPRPESEWPRAVIWLEPPRDWLHHRINQRVDAMLAAGWLDETRRLLDRSPPPGRTASQAIGYRELIEYLRGSLTFEQAVQQIRAATRQFAKRQHTWFRNLEECRPLPVRGTETPEEIAAAIEQRAHRPLQTREDTTPNSF